MTIPTTPDVVLPTVMVEAVARAVVHDWLAYLGYTPDQIATADRPRRHTAECQLTEHGWECFDENLTDQHPEHTAADEAAYLVMFTLQHPSAAALLQTTPFEPAEPVDTEGTPT